MSDRPEMPPKELHPDDRGAFNLLLTDPSIKTETLRRLFGPAKDAETDALRARVAELENALGVWQQADGMAVAAVECGDSDEADRIMGAQGRAMDRARELRDKALGSGEES